MSAAGREREQMENLELPEYRSIDGAFIVAVCRIADSADYAIATSGGDRPATVKQYPGRKAAEAAARVLVRCYNQRHGHGYRLVAPSKVGPFTGQDRIDADEWDAWEREYAGRA